MYKFCSLIGRFQRRYPGVVMLTFAAILLTISMPVSAAAAKGDDASRHYQTGLKLLGDQSETATRSIATANSWFAMAAMKGHDDAQFHLGVSFQNGRGVNKNIKTAIYFYRLAAMQHHATAQYNLAVIYINGTGVERDYEAALTLLRVAQARTGLSENDKAQINSLIGKIQPQMRHAQISRAEWNAAQITGSKI